MKVFYDSDAQPELLRDKTIAIAGYGSQGHAQAQNLRDSGFRVIIALDPGRGSAKQAAADGFEVLPVAEAVKRADLIQVLAPDEHHRELFETHIRPNLKPNAILMASHGFSIHFKQIIPPPTIDVVMVAPKGPGHLVRRVYTEGRGVPSLVAVAQDASGKAQDYALAFRLRDRRHAGRSDRHELPRRDRNRPLRRTIRALRRPDIADEGGL